MINKLAQEIHENAKSKGFYDDEKNIGEMLCLIHLEVSEALECDRKSKYCCVRVKPVLVSNEDVVFKSYFEESIKDTFGDELADIVIRVFDMAVFRGVDIENHILAKMRYNSLRPHKHGKKY